MCFAFDQLSVLYEGNVLMDSIKAYVLRIIIVAIVCSITSSLLKEKTASGKMVNLLCGILMAITILSPIVSISFRNVTDFYYGISTNAERYVNNGKTAAQEEAANIIKSQTEAYILDKAKNLGLQITVEVELDDSNNSVPCGAVINGAVSPYAKGTLEGYMQEQLGIPKENQIWN